MTQINILKHDAITPNIGATVDLDIADLLTMAPEEQNSLVDKLYNTLLHRLVVFIPAQQLSAQQQIKFGRMFGDLDRPHPLYQQHTEFPEVVILENDGNTPPDTNDWHTDLTFRDNPPFMSILYAREVPSTGGDTVWANMYAAWDNLPDSMKELVANLTAIHDMGTFRNDYLGDNLDVQAVNQALATVGSAVHPVAPTHPVTSRRYLFVNRSFTQHIVGMKKGESDRLLGYLYDHMNQPEFQIRFRWQNNTIALWENRVTQHYAIADYLPNYRRMQRVTVINDKRGVQDG